MFEQRDKGELIHMKADSICVSSSEMKGACGDGIHDELTRDLKGE